MKTLSSILVVPVACMAFVSILPTTIVSARKNKRKKRIPRKENCPLWIAPSNVHATNELPIKYGIYAGQDYAQNSTLPFSELVIPIIDFFHTADLHHRNNKEKKNDSNIHDENNNHMILKFVEDLLWAPAFAGSTWEGNISVPVLIPGIGGLGQYHTTYSNAEFIHAAVLKRNPLVSVVDQEEGNNNDNKEGGVGGSSNNSGSCSSSTTFPVSGKAHLLRGAITPYYNATLHATEHIPAGMEIFPDFGSSWDGNFTANVYQDTIHRYDYEIADRLVDALIVLLDKFPDLSLDMQMDVMDFMLQKVLRTATGANAITIRSLIPDNPRKLKKVQQAGGTFLYRYQDMIKSNKWLHENGFCLDTIQSGISTIPNAGRGAFATRNISKGETITVTPMIHIANRELMDMYPLIYNESDNEETKQFMTNSTTHPLIGKQLIINYAFGHAESSMLLIPLGPQVMLINHGGKQANAYITWSQGKDDIIKNHKPALEATIETMAKETNIVLVMKIVALRPIQEDEEITLNYGPSWQQAWEQYEAKWRQVLQESDHPRKADDLNVMYKNRPFETIVTHVENPYPDTVQLACLLTTKPRPDGTLMTNQKHGWPIEDFDDPFNYNDVDGETLCKVLVLERMEDPTFYYNYTVRAQMGDEDDTIVEVWNVPHAACNFVDKPYTSDIHLPWAFRRHIEISDSLFPISWRNLRLKE